MGKKPEVSEGFQPALPHQAVVPFVDSNGDLLAGTGLPIEYPNTVQLGGVEFGVRLRLSNLPSLPNKRNSLLPLKTVTIDRETDAGGNDLPLRYSPKTGDLDISSSGLYQLAEAIITKDDSPLTHTRKQRRKFGPFLRWAHNVSDAHPDLQNNLEEGTLDDVDIESNTVKLMEWLATNAVLQHATLASLPVPQAVYRRYLQQEKGFEVAEPIIALVIEAAFPIHGVGLGLAAGDSIARTVIDSRLNETIDEHTKPLHRAMTPQGPLIKFER